MTNTVTPTNGSSPRKRAGRKSAVGEYKHKRTGIDVALGLLTPLVGQDFLDRYNLRDPLNRTLRYGVKTMFSTAGAPPVSSSESRASAAGRPGSRPAARTTTT